MDGWEAVWGALRHPPRFWAEKGRLGQAVSSFNAEVRLETT
jgi:hypothetical protein